MVLAVVSLMGCTSSRLRYGVEMRNGTSEEVNDVSVNFDGFRSGGGVLVPGGVKSYQYVPRPVPLRATVVWRTGDGQLHERGVDVPTVSRDLIQDGMLIFTIRDAHADEVDVQADGAPPALPKYLGR